MALGHYIKEQMLGVFQEKINRSRSIILCAAQGLKAGEIGELRAEMDKKKVDFFLIKKTLASMVFKKAKIDISPFLNGDIFYAIAPDDPIAASKILVNFARSHEALKIKGGVIDKKIVEAHEIKRYASIPSKEILIQQLMSTIKAPMTNLALILQAPLRKLVLTLEAIRESNQKQKSK